MRLHTGVGLGNVGQLSTLSAQFLLQRWGSHWSGAIWGLSVPFCVCLPVGLDDADVARLRLAKYRV